MTRPSDGTGPLVGDGCRGGPEGAKRGESVARAVLVLVAGGPSPAPYHGTIPLSRLSIPRPPPTRGTPLSFREEGGPLSCSRRFPRGRGYVHSLTGWQLACYNGRERGAGKAMLQLGT